MRARRARRRGATMLEFVLIVPLLMFTILFTVDMGRVILVNGGMHDAAYSAARAGAQVGGGGLHYQSGKNVCQNGTVCAEGSGAVARRAFNSAASTLPGAQLSELAPTVRITTGSVCSANPVHAGNAYVTVQATYSTKLLTPGLAQALSITGGDIQSGRWQSEVVAVARCEIVR